MSNIVFSETELAHIVYHCDAATYKILSDPGVSKVTASMSEEGREAVAACVAKKLRELLEQTAEQTIAGDAPSRVFIEARPYNLKDLGL